VLARGQLLIQGQIRDLMQPHDRIVEVRVKVDQARFARGLVERGCSVQALDDLLRVQLPEGEGGSRDLLWQLAASLGEQIRYLRPQSSTLEEVFLKAVDGHWDPNVGFASNPQSAIRNPHSEESAIRNRK
jgi:hypothetical protein